MSAIDIEASVVVISATEWRLFDCTPKEGEPSPCKKKADYIAGLTAKGIPYFDHRVGIRVPLEVPQTIDVGADATNQA